jgi:ectoine hydroxylase-related dioxygenase (phytanoyl-CoA dioxygenase family)
MNYEFEKYACAKEKILETLALYGVAIVPNVLDAHEVDAMVKGMWSTLEFLTQKFETPIIRDKPETYASIKFLRPIETVIFQQWSIGHAQFIWALRQNPKIAQIFAHIWNVNMEDLLVSFDGASFQMPPEITEFGFYDEEIFHTDQSLSRNNLECIQSWITAFDVNEHDATLTFLEGSNKFHGEFAKRFNIRNTDDWYVVSRKESQMKFYIEEKLCVPKCIKCPAGSLVLWDSRTIHFGLPAQQERIKPNFRCVAYICMLPRNVSNESEIKKKQRAFEEMMTTSHWPNKIITFPTCFFANAKNPVQKMPRPVLDSLGLKLAGF